MRSNYVKKQIQASSWEQKAFATVTQCVIKPEEISTSAGEKLFY